MPFVYYDEVPEGLEGVDVRSVADYEAVSKQRDDALEQIGQLRTKVDELVSARDVLQRDLEDAKAKFADAFLSSASTAKRKNDEDLRGEDRPMTFGQLFRGRNEKHAN